jgi:hypothetical protein
MTLSDKQQRLCDESPYDYSDLSALFLNCTLKPSPHPSHTRTLIDVSAAIMEENDVDVEIVRPVDLDLAPGVYGDMTDHGFETDDGPALYETVLEADILVLGSPIWLGEKSSVCQQVIERLYANSSDLNDRGQYAYYGRVGGCLITGNEDESTARWGSSTPSSISAIRFRRRPTPGGSGRPVPGRVTATSGTTARASGSTMSSRSATPRS